MCRPICLRGIMAALLAVGTSFCLAFSAAAALQADPKDEPKVKEPEKLECKTADGVKINGMYYPSEKGKDAPVVILCHGIGDGKKTGASRKDFGDLPKALQKEGYAVVAFDFRGYGESKSLADPMLYFRINPPLRPFPGGKLPTTIDAAKDFRTASAIDYAKLGNDLNAIKDYIVDRGNARDCNATNVVVVGAEQGAVLAMFWAFNEFSRPKTNAIVARESEGEDITAFVWVSMRPYLKDRVDKQVQACIGQLYTKIPTLAIYGADDRPTASFWKTAETWLKPKNEKGDVVDASAAIALKTDVQGAKIFDQESIDAAKVITDYLKKNLPVRPWKERKGERPPDSLFAIDRLGLK